jgi:hypothetical protein
MAWLNVMINIDLNGDLDVRFGTICGKAKGGMLLGGRLARAQS